LAGECEKGEFFSFPRKLVGLTVNWQGFEKMDKVQSSKFEVEKFNGKTNFELWKLKMKDLLVQQGLQKALAGRIKETDTMTNDEWDDLDARALSTICLCLADDVLFNIVGEETTTGLWTRLEGLYMTKSLTNRIYLKRQLYGLRMKEGMKVIDHLSTFNTLIVQLASMEVKLEDEDKEVTLLCLFPESWDHLVTSISLVQQMFLIMTLLWELYWLRR
jgi:hypothetical protein